MNGFSLRYSNDGPALKMALKHLTLVWFLLSILVLPIGITHADTPDEEWSISDYLDPITDCITKPLDVGGTVYWYPQDYVDGLTPEERYCDRYEEDVVERPTPSDNTEYYSDIDIERILPGLDGTFFYLAFDVVGTGINDILDAYFYYELDLDNDNRGDFVVLVKSPSSFYSANSPKFPAANEKDWYQENVEIYEDADNDVGCTDITNPDDPPGCGNGYETEVWKKDSVPLDGAWARIRSDDHTVVEIAVERSLIGYPTKAKLRAWVDNGAKSLDQIYYHDAYSASSYGSPYPDHVDYPSGNISKIDNTIGVGDWPEITTAVVISSFGAYAAGGEVAVEWQTASERGTLGFDLLRQDGGEWVKVNDELLPGLLISHRGGTYRYVDASAQVGESYTYKLVEHELWGTTRSYGPFSVTADQPPPEETRALFTSGKRYQSEVLPEPAETKARLEGLRSDLEALFKRLGGGDAKPEVVTPAPVIVKKTALQAFLERLGLVAKPATEPVATTAALEPQSSTEPQTMASLLQALGVLFNPASGDGTAAAKIGVTTPGLYTLTDAEIAKALGLSSWRVRSLLDNYQLALSNQGQPVSYVTDGQSLSFFGEPPTKNAYTHENVYWLARGPGKKAPTGSVGVPWWFQSGQAGFESSVHVEQDVLHNTSIIYDIEEEFWFWKLLNSSSDELYEARQRFEVASPTGAGGELSVELWAIIAGEHQVTAWLNDTSLGTVTLTGKGERTARYNVAPGTLFDGENELRLTCAGPDGALSLLYFNALELAYTRGYTAAAGQLIFTAQGAVNVSGLRSAAALYDVSDPWNMKQLTGARTRSVSFGNYALNFKGIEKTAYLAADRGRAPAWIAPAGTLDLKNPPNGGAQYVIVTPGFLAETAAELAAHRQAQGFSTLVVEVSRIMEEFNYGVSHPQAIVDFFDYAWHNWAIRLQYGVLVGDGSLDYKDVLGHGENLVPPLLTATPFGLSTTDIVYGDTQNNDAVAEIAMGRIPVLTNAELEAFIAKLKAYEGQVAPQQVLLLADKPDSGGEFTTDSEAIAGLIPASYGIDKVYMANMALAAAQAKTLADIEAGEAFVNYIGHGSQGGIGQEWVNTVDGWKLEWLLSVDDVSTLTNVSLPVVTLMTCTAGDFGAPGESGVSETLVLHTGGGASAVWGPSGYSLNRYARFLNRGFYNAVFTTGVERIGDVARAAAVDAQSQGMRQWMQEIYNLMGDPAMVIAK